MPATVLYMSMSLDGFIAGPDDGPGNGLGDDGHRLHAWLADGGVDPASYRPADASGTVFDELMATGAVVVGRRTFEIAGSWNGDHHDDVPIFVLTRRPEGGRAWPNVTYVTDVADAMARAKDAGGGRNVLVHGARTAQLALAAGALDELEIHQIPVLLGEGRRLFEGLGREHIELELARVIDAPGVTHLRYRVRR